MLIFFCDKHRDPEETLGIPYYDMKQTMWDQGRVLLSSYPGAKVSWCTLGTKNRVIHHHYFYYYFTCVEHLLCAQCFIYTVSLHSKKKNIKALCHLHFQ